MDRGRTKSGSSRRPRTTFAASRCLSLGAIVIASTLALAGPAFAADPPACPEANPTATSNCGPPLTLPLWGDGAGWDDPSKYSTIQLADVNGDGRDELLGRNDTGLEIWQFDTTLGQWRPQVDAKDDAQVLVEFRSPKPSDSGPDWRQAEYYATIQAADVDNQPGEDIVARFPDGVHVFHYQPPAGTNSVNGGRWSESGSSGPFRDADGWTDPSLYLTLQTDQLFGPYWKSSLWSRLPFPGDSLRSYQFNGSGWDQVNGNTIDTYADCSQPSCYLDLTAYTTNNGIRHVVGRSDKGIDTWLSQDAWTQVRGGTQGPPSSWIFSQQSGVDCPFSNTHGDTSSGNVDCLATSPSYYETLQAADIVPGGNQELLARANDGLRVKQFNETSWESLPTLKDLVGGASPAGWWSSIQTANLDGKGGEEVLALAQAGCRRGPTTPARRPGTSSSRPRRWRSARTHGCRSPRTTRRSRRATSTVTDATTSSPGTVRHPHLLL